MSDEKERRSWRPSTPSRWTSSRCWWRFPPRAAGADPGGGLALPSGLFELGHRSLQSGLRAWVEQQTHHPIGYVEQLYTFADKDRAGEGGPRTISISYLGLTHELSGGEGAGAAGTTTFPRTTATARRM